MIRFAAPEWLIFLPVLFGIGFWRRELRLWEPLRASCLALLILILIEPQIRRLGRELDLWVLVDRSASAADALEPRLAETQTLLERAKTSDDRLFYIDYANIAQVRGDVDEIPPHQRQQTRTALAIHTALGHLDAGRSSRLLVLTDGYSTEPLGNATERLIRQHAPLDYRLAAPPDEADYRVESFTLPTRVQLREPFVIDVKIAGTPDATVPLTIWRDGQQIGATDVALRGGAGSARFTDRMASAGSHKYSARIAPPADARPGNNVADRWIEIVGGPRLLLVTSYTSDPVAEILKAQGFEIEIVTDLATVNVGQLTGVKAVILNNVPAYRLASEFVSSLDFFVRAQGGGMLMAGGKYSFGAGGWFGSAVDDLLPVSMELRAEHRKLAVAMAIVMDRSGSMSASVPGGAQKMDLADEGAARSIDLLTPMDAVSVLAVDTEPHRIVELSTIGKNRGQLTNTVRRITSAGGGICVPTGLRAAQAELKKATAGQRHVIVFADANDATQELGDYQSLIAEMVKEGITISVIGMGSDHDSGAKFLTEVANLGKGRIFFNADPAQLPAMFAQETVTVARSAFIDETTKLIPSPGWREMAAKPLSWLDAVDGYNLSYLKPEATGSALTGDEYAAPLVAQWHRGAGRVAAVSFPLGGDFSQRVRSWPAHGDFLQTLNRWLMGESVPPGIGLRTKMEGTELQVELLFDASWEPKIAEAAPLIVLADGASGEARPIAWERLEPGRFRATAPLDPERWVRGAVQVGGFTLPFGPVMAGSSAEWMSDPTRLAELKMASQLSGGLERIDLSKIWQAPRREEFRDIRAWLILILLTAFLADVLMTRLAWQLPKFARIRFPVPARPRSAKARTEPVPSPEPVVAAKEEKPEQRQSRFARAKRGR